MEESAIERLAAKSPEEAIIERIGRDFNLAPFLASSSRCATISRSTWAWNAR